MFPEETPEDTTEVLPEETPEDTMELQPEEIPEATTEVLPQETPDDSMEVQPEETPEDTTEVLSQETPEDTIEVLPEEIPEATFDLSKVSLPCKTKRSGRLKGTVNRVIGLPKVKSTNSTDDTGRTEQKKRGRPKGSSMAKPCKKQCIQTLHLTKIPGSDEWLLK